MAAATKLPVVLHGHFSDALLARLVTIENVEAMKEDRLLEDYVRQQIDHGKRLVIFGGGGEDRYYVAWPHGAQAYYSTYSTFAPDIPAKIWKLIQTGEIRAAARSLRNTTILTSAPSATRSGMPPWSCSESARARSARRTRCIRMRI